MGRYPKDPSAFQTGLTTRQATPEEAQKYGIKTLLDQVDWFVDSAVDSYPSISLSNSGVRINKKAAELLGISRGDYVRVGVTAGKPALVLKKSEDGTGMRVKRNTSAETQVFVHSVNLIKWLKKRGIVFKGYVLQVQEHSGTYYADVDIVEVAAD